jgi:hypothetical protein
VACQLRVAPEGGCRLRAAALSTLSSQPLTPLTPPHPHPTQPQFRYLSRLLLLHGRWSYMRNEEVVLYSFYKNWTYTLVFLYLQFVAGAREEAWKEGQQMRAPRPRPAPARASRAPALSSPHPRP